MLSTCHTHTNSFLDQYEQDVDEIVAACNAPEPIERYRFGAEARLQNCNTKPFFAAHRSARHGDLRGAVKALMLVNEQLEEKL
jgi:hypothetical protein